MFDESFVTNIMENGPWNIKGALFVVKPWPQELTYEEVDLTCAFLVQVHGLPLRNMTAVNAIRISKFIGSVINVENGEHLGIIYNHHLRIRIALDTSQPLVSGFHLPRHGRSSIWVKFLYERLADYCPLCGLIGHRKSFCSAPPPPGPQDRYGFSLKRICLYWQPLCSYFSSGLSLCSHALFG